MRKLRDTVSLCEGLRMRRAVSDGAIVKAPFVELADVELRHRCRVRLCTQMQDVEFGCRMQDCTGLGGPVVPSMLRLQPLRYRCGVDGDSALGSAASHIILGLIPHCPRTASVVSETTISAAALSTAGGYRRVARFGKAPMISDLRRAATAHLSPLPPVRPDCRHCEVPRPPNRPRPGARGRRSFMKTAVAVALLKAGHGARYEDTGMAT